MTKKEKEVKSCPNFHVLYNTAYHRCINVSNSCRGHELETNILRPKVYTHAPANIHTIACQAINVGRSVTKCADQDTLVALPPAQNVQARVDKSLPKFL